MRTLLLGFSRDKFPEERLSQIREAAPSGLRVVVTNSREEIEPILGDIEIAAAGFPRDLISKAGNLRWLQQWGAGANWLMDHPEVVEQNLIVTSGSGIHAIPITEHIFAFLLNFARSFHLARDLQSQHHWKGLRRSDVFELVDKTMVLIGVGAIGERTAQVAKALGMRVLGVRRNPSLELPDIETMVGPERLPEVLPQADVVVLTAPLTHETQKIIGEEELRAMKSTAILVNIGRGGTVDEQALIQALQEGWIAGAGLDVCEIEPLPDDSPLWDMENVIITGHYAGITPLYDERALEIFLENLQRYRDGKTLINVVDKKLGY